MTDRSVLVGVEAMPHLTENGRHQRRQRLLDASWRCTVRRGLQDMSIDDVCLEAGISKGAF